MAASGTQHLVWDRADSPAPLLSDGEESYLYGPNGLPVEQISSEEVPTYLHHDQLGSTRMLTDGAGGAVGTFSYGAYGASTGKTGSATTALGYAGQYTLNQSGLLYLRARMYDPDTGQFLTKDPLTPTTLAPYSYANNNPVNGVDPSGLCNANPFSGAFWTEGNCISESSLNPLRYYEEEKRSWENGCGYWSSVLHGLKGAAVATADASVIGGALEAASLAGETGPEISEANAEHIFRDEPNHLVEDTAENRALLEDAVKPENYVSTQYPDVRVYHELLPNGEQIWVEVRNGQITNGGVNTVPR